MQPLRLREAVSDHLLDVAHAATEDLVHDLLEAVDGVLVLLGLERPGVKLVELELDAAHRLLQHFHLAADEVELEGVQLVEALLQLLQLAVLLHELLLQLVLLLRLLRERLAQAPQLLVLGALTQQRVQLLLKLQRALALARQFRLQVAQPCAQRVGVGGARGELRVLSAQALQRLLRVLQPVLGAGKLGRQVVHLRRLLRHVAVVPGLQRRELLAQRPHALLLPLAQLRQLVLLLLELAFERRVVGLGGVKLGLPVVHLVLATQQLLLELADASLGNNPPRTLRVQLGAVRPLGLVRVVLLLQRGQLLAQSVLLAVGLRHLLGMPLRVLVAKRLQGAFDGVLVALSRSEHVRTLLPDVELLVARAVAPAVPVLLLAHVQQARDGSRVPRQLLLHRHVARAPHSQVALFSARPHLGAKGQHRCDAAVHVQRAEARVRRAHVPHVHGTVVGRRQHDGDVRLGRLLVQPRREAERVGHREAQVQHGVGVLFNHLDRLRRLRRVHADGVVVGARPHVRPEHEQAAHAVRVARVLPQHLALLRPLDARKVVRARPDVRLVDVGAHERVPHHVVNVAEMDAQRAHELLRLVVVHADLARRCPRPHILVTHAQDARHKVFGGLTLLADDARLVARARVADGDVALARRSPHLVVDDGGVANVGAVVRLLERVACLDVVLDVEALALLALLVRRRPRPPDGVGDNLAHRAQRRERTAPMHLGLALRRRLAARGVQHGEHGRRLLGCLARDAAPPRAADLGRRRHELLLGDVAAVAGVRLDRRRVRVDCVAKAVRGAATVAGTASSSHLVAAVAGRRRTAGADDELRRRALEVERDDLLLVNRRGLGAAR
mmetsp:Transcript_7932/g.28223  ORF Transcript_7932/g.28223 Transcript_7932/m.28223 type:complete len:842 (+) Transcript_7932:156-2681(+)